MADLRAVPALAGRRPAPQAEHVTPAASALGRLLAGLIGLASAGAGAWLAMHHPLAPVLALAGVLLLAAAQAAWAPLWLVALPALLPWLGLAPWTGWLMVEEMDLAMLAVSAGAYLRWAAWPGPRVRASPASRLMRAWGLLLLALWTASVLVAMQRGAVDAGGWSAGWWQGYREPLNALRLAKPTLAVWLLLPLWWQLQQRPGGHAADHLTRGLAWSLAGTTVWCLWERQANPGLLNFATDYRTTGPFWEMHVGGAALDVWLALTLPFALRLYGTARSPGAWAAAAVIVLGAVYASLTTFSRIVYLALPLGVALMVWLQHRQGLTGPAAQPAAAGTGSGNETGTGRPPAAGLAPALLLCAGVGLLAFWLFPSAGYRGLLALLGNALVLMLLAPPSVRRPALLWAGALLLGVALGGAVVLLALQFNKGGYWAFGAATLATAALALAQRRWPQPLLWLLASAGFLVQLACTVVVAVGWGGAPAWVASTLAAAMLALAWGLLSLRPQPPWPSGARWFGGTALGLLLVMAGLAVFEGGNYMASRLEQSAGDRQDRWSHWRDGLALQSGGVARWLGQGLGRFADVYSLNGPPANRPGEIRLMAVDGAPAMRLVAASQAAGHSQLLRLSQRIARPPGLALTVALQVRTAGPVQLYAEVCLKHLLYDDACRLGTVATLPGNTGWQTLRVDLPPGPVPVDDWFAPRLTVLSLAIENARGVADVRSVALTDAAGRSYLHNGQFADGGARWFSTSDRNHLPWHAKNIAVHLLFEQGVLGLAAFLALSLAALAGLAGPLRRHPLAPALAAALVGCWVVGAVDSVLDMPRVAGWLLLLTAMALSLHLPSRAGLPRGVRAGPVAAPRARQPLATGKRLAWLALALVVLLPTLALAGLWCASAYAGRTPDELIDHAEGEVQRPAVLKAIGLPLLAALRQVLGEQQAGALTTPFTVPALPPNPAYRLAARPAAGAPPAITPATPPTITPATAADAALIRVGPTRAVKTIAQAARLVRDGSVVEIDPGDYRADVAVFGSAHLTLRGMGARVRLIADGAHAEGKAIWVIRSGRVTVENIDFIGARVPDRNGAGIRLESGQLTVRNCLFYGNENGILTASTPDATLRIENSEFAFNGHGDGLTHHLYVNAIESLTVTGSYFHHANVGHLLKSRARINRIAYNRLSDDIGGRASYELELPNGGDALVMGNLIQQSAQTSNSNIVSYGAEGNLWPNSRLRLVHNTLVNDHPGGGTLLRVSAGAEQVRLRNNLLVGKGRIDVASPLDEVGDAHVKWDHFVDAGRMDYRPKSNGPGLGPLPAQSSAPAAADEWPQYEYVHPAQTQKLLAPPKFPGAFQTTGP